MSYDALLSQRRSLAVCSMKFTDDERDLLLAGLFELRITHAEDHDRVLGLRRLSDGLAVIRLRCSSVRLRIRSGRHPCRNIRPTRPMTG